MDDIVYRRLDKLDSVERAVVEKICNREFSKIRRSVPDSSLVTDIKKLNAEGRRANYNVKLRVDAPNVKLFADHSDWELQRALHRAFDNLKVEVEHKFRKKEVKWPKRIRKE